jgi:hypothetical protein
MSAVATRLRKLEAKRPSGLCALSDEELGARIDAIMAVYGSVDAIAASYRADGNEPAALSAVFRLSGGAVQQGRSPEGLAA